MGEVALSLRQVHPTHLRNVRPSCCFYQAVIKPYLYYDVHRPNDPSGTMFSTTQVLPKPLTYSKRQCTSWFIFQEVGMQVVISAVEVMLIIRGKVFTVPFLDCPLAYSREAR